MARSDVNASAVIMHSSAANPPRNFVLRDMLDINSLTFFPFALPGRIGPHYLVKLISAWKGRKFRAS
jgi:hypothetical protein